MAQRATSLGPKPSLFSFCLFGFLFFFFAFLSLFFNRQKKLIFPLEKGNFCLFSMFPFLSPWTFFGLPLFLFLFLCLSLSLVFLSSFLSFFLLSFCFLFLSLVHFSFFFAFVSWKEQDEHFQLQFLFFSEMFSLSFGFLSCFFFLIPFSYLCFLPDFKLCFLFNINVFSFKKKQNWKAHIFGQKGGCNKTVFLWTCVLQNVKSYRFFCPFFAQILVGRQKHYKIGVSAKF